MSWTNSILKYFISKFFWILWEGNKIRTSWMGISTFLKINIYMIMILLEKRNKIPFYLFNCMHKFHSLQNLVETLFHRKFGKRHFHIFLFCMRTFDIHLSLEDSHFHNRSYTSPLHISPLMKYRHLSFALKKNWQTTVEFLFFNLKFYWRSRL